MFCEKCGRRINDNAAFCPACGAAQHKAPAEDMSLVADGLSAPATPAAPAAPTATKRKNSASVGCGVPAAILGIIDYFVWVIVSVAQSLENGGEEIGTVVALVFLGIIGSIAALVGSIMSSKNKLSGLIMLGVGLFTHIIAYFICYGMFAAFDLPPVAVFGISMVNVITVALLVMAVCFSVVGVKKNWQKKADDED